MEKHNPGLGNRFTNHRTRRKSLLWKVTLIKPFIASEVLEADCSNPRLDFHHAIKHKKWKALRNDLLNLLKIQLKRCSNFT